MSAGIRNVNRFAATVAVTWAARSRRRFLELAVTGRVVGKGSTNAKRLLVAAGGENEELSCGTGTDTQQSCLMPNTSPFSSACQPQTARRWLDATFGISRISSYVDHGYLFMATLLACLIIGGGGALLLSTTYAEGTSERSYQEVYSKLRS